MTNRTLLRRVDSIDVIRGLSIFLVLMNHVHMRLFSLKIPYLDGIHPQIISSLVWSGQRGVQIFFCISGYLIASTSIKRWGSLAQIKARDFYWFRVARIVPLFAVLLLALSLLHFSGIEHFVVSEKTGGLSGALFAALTLRVNVLEATLGYLPGNWDILWSLSVEEMFYLFFPIACLLFGRTKLFFGILATFIILGPLGRTVYAQGNEVWAEYSYLGCMDAIAFGVVTALLSSRFNLSSLSLKWTTGIGLLIVVCSLSFSKTLNHLGLNALGLDMTVLAIGTCLIIFSTVQTNWKASRAFYPLSKLGERSYEIYLTHMFVIYFFFNLFQRFGANASLIPWFFILSILVSGLVGELVGRYYAEPLNSILRKNNNKFRLKEISWT